MSLRKPSFASATFFLLLSGDDTTENKNECEKSNYRYFEFHKLSMCPAFGPGKPGVYSR